MDAVEVEVSGLKCKKVEERSVRRKNKQAFLCGFHFNENRIE